MSAGTYEYISDYEMIELRSQWKDLVDKIKTNQPEMVRVKIDDKTTLEIAKNKNINKVLKNYRQGRERYYLQD